MKPFPPDIEAPLLKRLRKHEVWPCFERSGRKIGQLGSRVVGFWESQNLKNTIVPSEEIDSGRSYVETVAENSPLDQKASYRTRGRERTSNEMITTVDVLWRKFLEAYFRALLKFGILIPRRIPLYLLYWYQNMAFNTFFPLTTLRWKYLFAEKEIFFAREFVLPSKQQRFFPNKVVGTYLSDSIGLRAREENQAAKDIYQGSVVGLPFLQRRPNPIQGLMFINLMFDVLYSIGEVWVRTLERRADGKPVVFLKKVQFVKGRSNSFFVYFQDVTDLYFEHLEP